MDINVKQNMLRCGEYLMYSIWIQSQLTDLIVFNRNKNIIKDFNAIQEKIPDVLKNERIKFWKKDFNDIKKDFENEFKAKLSVQDKADLDTIFYIRNAIAHSHVSLTRSFLFYVPSSSKKEMNFRDSLDILNKNDSNLNQPSVFKIDFSNDAIYFHNFNAIKRIDEILLDGICKELDIPHSRIR